MKKFTIKNILRSSSTICLAILATTMFISACNKSTDKAHNPVAGEALKTLATVPLVQHEPITNVMTIANIRQTADGSVTRVMFNRNEQIFSVSDATIIATLKKAFGDNTAVRVTFDPWQATVLQVSQASATDQQYFHSRPVATAAGAVLKLDAATCAGDIDHAADMGVLNLTTDTLTNVIPDFATAQLMFDYIGHQCCQLPGPYAIDYCISFQYCQDGCYARAHKMCMIINSKYHYGTKKVFSFANAGVDELCVKAEKWGGCCINWWYHVAPLVTIKTPTGPKAYVFDPAMFDQPVLLSAWLHAQANPDCVPGGDVPHVSMINIQPTASYSPAGFTGYSFDTDPLYVDTDYWLFNYGPLATCH